MSEIKERTALEKLKDSVSHEADKFLLDCLLSTKILGKEVNKDAGKAIQAYNRQRAGAIRLLLGWDGLGIEGYFPAPVVWRTAADVLSEEDLQAFMGQESKDSPDDYPELNFEGAVASLEARVSEAEVLSLWRQAESSESPEDRTVYKLAAILEIPWLTRGQSASQR